MRRPASLKGKFVAAVLGFVAIAPAVIAALFLYILIGMPRPPEANHEYEVYLWLIAAASGGLTAFLVALALYLRR